MVELGKPYSLGGLLVGESELVLASLAIIVPEALYGLASRSELGGGGDERG